MTTRRSAKPRQDRLRRSGRRGRRSTRPKNGTRLAKATKASRICVEVAVGVEVVAVDVGDDREDRREAQEAAVELVGLGDQVVALAEPRAGARDAQAPADDDRRVEARPRSGWRRPSRSSSSCRGCRRPRCRTSGASARPASRRGGRRGCRARGRLATSGFVVGRSPRRSTTRSTPCEVLGGVAEATAHAERAQPVGRLARRLVAARHGRARSSSRTSAMPLIPAPPMPTKWMRERPAKLLEHHRPCPPRRRAAAARATAGDAASARGGDPGGGVAAPMPRAARHRRSAEERRRARRRAARRRSLDARAEQDFRRAGARRASGRCRPGGPAATANGRRTAGAAGGADLGDRHRAGARRRRGRPRAIAPATSSRNGTTSTHPVRRRGTPAARRRPRASALDVAPRRPGGRPEAGHAGRDPRQRAPGRRSLSCARALAAAEHEEPTGSAPRGGAGAADREERGAHRHAGHRDGQRRSLARRLEGDRGGASAKRDSQRLATPGAGVGLEEQRRAGARGARRAPPGPRRSRRCRGRRRRRAGGSGRGAATRRAGER